MKSKMVLVMALGGCLALLSAVSGSQAETWKNIDDPDQVRQLIVDKTFDGNYWKYYFRSDGKMAYEQDGFVSVREWTVNEAGEVCTNIYGLPEKILGCEKISQIDDKPARYRFEGQTGAHSVQILEPQQALIDAVLEKAGNIE